MQTSLVVLASIFVSGHRLYWFTMMWLRMAIWGARPPWEQPWTDIAQVLAIGVLATLAQLALTQASQNRIQGWVDDPTTLEGDRLLALIERIGKGRFAQALAPRVTDAACPDYIRRALEHIRDAVA